MNWGKITFVTTSLILLIGCSKPINNNSLVDRDGLKYQQDSQKPYSGKVFNFWDNGNMKLEGSYKDGLMNGKWTWYREDGKKMVKAYYVDGNGNGDKMIYEDLGIPRNGADGELTFWNENGQKMYKGTFKDGEQDGKWTFWYENGQKKERGNFKNDKRIGEWTYYNDDGSIKEVKDFGDK